MAERPQLSEGQRMEMQKRAEELRQKVEANRQLIDAGPWSTGVKEFAKRYFTANVTQIPERLDFVTRHVPEDVLAAAGKDTHLPALLSGRLPFLEIVRSQMGQASWEAALRETPGFTKDVAALGIAADVKYARFQEGHYDQLNGRSETPLELDDDSPERHADAQDLREVLRETGFDEIAKALVTHIRVMTPEDPNDAHGVYQNATGGAGVWASGQKRFMLPPVLFHEVGHAFDKRAKNHEQGQVWSDRYAVSAYLRPETAGWYADSYTKSEQGGRTSARFHMESFAEDFRHYWIDQDSILPERRELIDEMMDTLFPTTDRDEIRVRIRTFLRAKYDVGPEDVKEPTDCGRSESAAQKRIEEARKRAEEYAARAAARKTV